MGVLFRRVVFPAWHWAKRDGVNAALRELEQNQWLSTPELLELQQRKLERLISSAGRHVPYYRMLLKQLDISPGASIALQDFRRIPPLTKRIIREGGQALVSEDLRGNRLRSNSTSGSTGEALRFYTDAHSMPYRQAAEIRSDSYTGWKLGDPLVRLWGSRFDNRSLTGHLRRIAYRLVTHSRFLSSFDLSASKMNEYVETIRTFKPVLLVGYAGPLEELAKHCQERGVNLPSLKAIISSAETLWPHQRKIVEEAFGISVFDRYGAREVSQVAGECEMHDGLHISIDRHFVEVVDEQSQPCQTGQVGRILVTDLDNYGMPLIRYDIGDRGALSGKSTCDCGRGLPLLAKIEGRSMEIVRTPDGRRIGGTFWTLLLRSRPGLRRFQVIQDSHDGVVIHFVREPGFNGAVLDYYRGRIQEHCGDGFDVQFVEKDSIDLTDAGKQRLIISRLTD